MSALETNSEKKIRKYIAHMPSLSTTISMVLKVCNSPDTTANDLNRVIALDPVLTGNVLKLINSAYYSMRDRVTSLTKAIIMLGMNTIKNLAISTAILGTLNKTKSVKASSVDAFWEHSICVGTAAKIIASIPELGLKNKDEFFDNTIIFGQTLLTQPPQKRRWWRSLIIRNDSGLLFACYKNK